MPSEPQSIDCRSLWVDPTGQSFLSRREILAQDRNGLALTCKLQQFVFVFDQMNRGLALAIVADPRIVAHLLQRLPAPGALIA